MKRSGQGTLHERVAIRFGTTLTANIICRIAGFFSNIAIARGLGVGSFGDLNFLVASFAGFTALIDMGASSAFYTFLSQKRRSRNFLLSYALWLTIQFIAIASAITWILPNSWVHEIWLNHSRENIFLAFIASFFMTQAWGSVSQLGEARRKTVWVQTFEVIQSVTHFILVCTVTYLGRMSLRVVLGLWIFEYSCISVILAPKLIAHNLDSSILHLEKTATILKDYLTYCRPLAVLGIFTFIYRFADRWLLQRFGGSIQQGYFSIAIQFSNVCLIATGSLIRIFWKEIAEAYQAKDYQRVQRFYSQVARGLYAFAAWSSCLLIPYAGSILGLTVGLTYLGATVSFALYLLYPVHNSLGQVEGTFFQAVGDTKTITKISVWTLIISLPATYFLLADRSALVPGLGLGSLGLVLKMVILQAGSVIWTALIIARMNRWKFQEMYQVYILAFFLSVAWICKVFATGFLSHFPSVASPLICMATGVTLYLALSFLSIYMRPELLGVDLEELSKALGGLRNAFRTREV